MCGIAGFAERDARGSSSPESAFALVHAMCDVIRHRGPDDEGVHTGPGVGLGMRRLSIIDLSTGHQPIHNETRDVWVVFNGEIYNYRELRRELESCGHRFYTSSDTESIVHAYEEWGSGAFERLRGMFGVAIWDARSRELFLARDRAGIKPLYYAEAAGRLYFGSELKSLLAVGDIERELDPIALDHFLSFLYTPPDRSIFRNVSKLPPGHFLRWANGAAAVTRYWQISAEESFRGSEEEAAARLRDVLAGAVRSHLVSDVPLGAFLSGGVDSSIVVGLMAEASSRVTTFSIGFDEPEYDELPYARAVARHFGTDHHEFVVRPDALAILDALIDHFDEPFADSSAIPTWYVCEIARRHVTVVLSGDGGDELFGGYDRYLPHPRVAAFDRLPIPGKRQAAAAIWPLLPHGTRGKNYLRHVSRDGDGRYLDSVAFFQADEKRALMSDELRAQLGRDDAGQATARRLRRFRSLPPQARMMRLDFETYLPEDVLTKVDRMSMAHSIESRVPLLDNEVIELAASLPTRFKIRDGRRKHILKRSAERLLPADVLGRRKQGFGVPIGAWFRSDLRELFHDVLLSPRTRGRGYFEWRFVDRIVREHLSNTRDHTLRLWQLLVFELWHRQYLDGGQVWNTRFNGHQRQEPRSRVAGVR
ncbi:MAG TPA: asparagine synthase (glutamine-hydrolyzing) [Vicinamibacterales bacterium]|nr:asparagine synthase (glutamine-hydrolyzing) [Vicinamibacterales bacterium]